MEYNLADLFESVVDVVPDRAALLYIDHPGTGAERALSYAELDAAANRIAHHLMDHGVKPGEHLGLHLHVAEVRSADELDTAFAVMTREGADALKERGLKLDLTRGKPGTDQTRIGVYWGKGELKKEVTSALAGVSRFPGDSSASNSGGALSGARHIEGGRFMMGGPFVLWRIGIGPRRSVSGSV